MGSVSGACQLFDADMLRKSGATALYVGDTLRIETVRQKSGHRPWTGAALVFSFGIGTLPGLLVLGTGGAGIIRRYRVQSEILAGLLMIAMAARLAVGAIVRIG